MLWETLRIYPQPMLNKLSHILIYNKLQDTQNTVYKQQYKIKVQDIMWHDKLLVKIFKCISMTQCKAYINIYIYKQWS